MKAVSVALKAHLAQEVTTLATLWKITRTDSIVFGFTDHTEDITYSAVTYEAATGYVPSAVKTSAGMNVDNLEVQAFLNSASMTEADLMAGLWDYADIEIVRVNYADLTMGHEWIRKGKIGNVKTGRTNFTAELRGMMQPLQQNIGRVYGVSCDADLGDTRCGVTIASYTVTGIVTTATNNKTFTDTSRTQADGYYDGGLLTWTSGLNNTYQMEVKTFLSDVFTLQQSMPNAIQVGDTYSVYTGCDKSVATCNTKFSNVVNFRGFPHIPGRDRMISGS